MDQNGLYGSSPGGSARPDKHSSSQAAARRLLKRIQYDESLDAKEWMVGLLETREQAERRSGAEAWSLRVHSSVSEHPFPEFIARYEAAGEEVPFHRIACFKQNGVLVWEADHLRHKGLLGSDGGGPQSHHGSFTAGSSPGSHFLLGASPPTGGFMARLAAAAAATSSSGAAAAAGGGSGPGATAGASAAAGAGAGAGPSPGLPPRCLSGSPMDASAAAGAGLSAAQPHGHAGSNDTPPHWRPHRLSGTDVGSASGGSSWGATHAGAPWPLAAGGSCPQVGGFSPALGSSPGSASGLLHGSGAAAGVVALSNSPHTVGWSGLNGAAPTADARGASAGGGSRQHAAAGSAGSSLTSASPGGSCGSSWAGISPLAAAAAGADSTPPAEAGEEEPPPLADYSELPEECWVDVLQRLGVRELCCAARVNTALRALASRPCLWVGAYRRLFGTPPPLDWSGPTVKRLCRRSELRAARWLEADVEGRGAGFAGTWCVQLDDSKVVSGDGCAVRLWAAESGRRIATLRGHGGRVTSVAFDEERILSGCSQGGLRLWSMDELKLLKNLRHHTGPVSATLLLHGMPVSGGKDGAVCLWDAAAPNSPLVALEAGGAVHALGVCEDRGYLATGSLALGLWDMETAQLLATLDAPSPASLLRGGGSSLQQQPQQPTPPGTGRTSAAGAAAAVEAPDLDVDDSLLLHDGWLLEDDEDDDDDASDSSDDDEDNDEAVAALAAEPSAAATAAGATHAAPGGGGDDANSLSTSSRSAVRPWTSISCHGSLLAAGRAGSVVLWDVRTQQAVGAITPAAPASAASAAGAAARGRGGSSAARARNHAPCVGVQLDDWRVVTGFAGPLGGSGGGGGGSGAGPSSSWWRGSGTGEPWADEGGAWAAAASSGHSLEVYDIRAVSSYSAAAGPEAAASPRSSSGSLWSAPPVMQLPLASRATCFQFHGQRLLVGQEGADCCLLSFHPPGSRSARAAAAWGYGAGAPGSSGGAGSRGPSYAAAGVACYGASPCGASPGAMFGGGGGGAGGGPPGAYLEDGAAAGAAGPHGGAGSSSGGKGRKKGGVKVPAKKQTRYPKRATR